jgi:hypothetical protein
MSPNHILRSTVLAILAISVVPGYAEVQQPDIAKLKADAQNQFKIISSDKLMANLGDQLDQADRVHDTKKFEEVSQKMDELEEKLPEYTALVGDLADADPNSEERSGDRFDNRKASRVL